MGQVGYQSDVQVRRPCLLLIGIEPGEEPAELGIRELAGALRVLRVRYPIPACQRIRIVRPHVIIVDRTVRAWSLAAIEQAAKEVGAPILQLGPLVCREVLGKWLRHALEASLASRAAREQSA
ncbi:MAG TPA: hypothetical protein VF765_38395 [Polyangiaceae bacterium]